MAKTEVAQAKDNAPVATYDYGDAAGEGFEGTTINDLSIPFISVLQALSPQLEDDSIEGAKAGQLFNTVTQRVVQQPLIVIPVLREESWVVWKPRAAGGGLVDRWEPSDQRVKAVLAKNGGSRIPPKGADGKTVPFSDGNGNDVIETHYVYCLIMDEEAEVVEGYCVIPFSSTKIKVYRDWTTDLFTQKGSPPIYANRSKISTTKNQNDAGQPYYNFRIQPLTGNTRTSLIDPSTELGSALLKEGQEFRKMIESGLARPAYDSAASSSPSADSDDTPF